MVVGPLGSNCPGNSSLPQMMSHEQKMSVARALAEAIRKKYSDVIFVGVYGSVARGEDDKYSDLEILVITRSQHRTFPVPFTLRDLPVDIYSETKKEAIDSIRKVDSMWPSRMSKYLDVQPLLDNKNIIREFRRTAKSIKKTEFEKRASDCLVAMREQVGKIRNAARCKDLPKCVEASTWLTYNSTLIVALLNRKYYTRHGIKSLKEAKNFKKLPKEYSILMKRLHSRKEVNILSKTAQQLHRNFVEFAKQNGVSERSYRNVTQALQ